VATGWSLLNELRDIERVRPYPITAPFEAPIKKADLLALTDIRQPGRLINVRSWGAGSSHPLRFMAGVVEFDCTIYPLKAFGVALTLDGELLTAWNLRSEVRAGGEIPYMILNFEWLVSKNQMEAP
jgi:hypothetical protein